jgi:hypothetical protein
MVKWQSFLHEDIFFIFHLNTSVRVCTRMNSNQFQHRDTNFPPLYPGFVSSKRNAQLANIEDVEERVAKRRKAIAGISQSEVVNDVGDGGDADEIEIDVEVYRGVR